jgi:hypothetical protein
MAKSGGTDGFGAALALAGGVYCLTKHGENTTLKQQMGSLQAELAHVQRESNEKDKRIDQWVASSSRWEREARAAQTSEARLQRDLDDSARLRTDAEARADQETIRANSEAARADASETRVRQLEAELARARAPAS